MKFGEFVDWVNAQINDGNLGLWELDECHNIINDVMNRAADEWDCRWAMREGPVTRHIIEKVNSRISMGNMSLNTNP